MDIQDGVYELVAGDGAGRLVSVKRGRIQAFEKGGDVVGRLEVPDQSFSLEAEQCPVSVEGGVIRIGDHGYPCRLVPSPLANT